MTHKDLNGFCVKYVARRAMGWWCQHYIRRNLQCYELSDNKCPYGRQVTVINNFHLILAVKIQLRVKAVGVTLFDPLYSQLFRLFCILEITSKSQIPCEFNWWRLHSYWPGVFLFPLPETPSEVSLCHWAALWAWLFSHLWSCFWNYANKTDPYWPLHFLICQNWLISASYHSSHITHQMLQAEQQPAVKRMVFSLIVSLVVFWN